MTLDAIALDVPARVRSLAGLADGDRARLDALGLRPGVSVTKILRAPLKDPVECLVGSQLMAIEARLLPLIGVDSA